MPRQSASFSTLRLWLQGCFRRTPLASVRWNSTIRPSRHLREMFHGIRPDCGGDGTRVVCGGTAHH